MTMDITNLKFMAAEELVQSLTTAELNHAYERALRESERIYEQEALRTTRLQQLLQAHENDDLQQQLAEAEAQVEDLEDQNQDTRDQLVSLEANLQRAQNDLRTRTRESEQYRAQVNAMNNVTSESTKLLTEKLALAREIATLKPEIEHLRSQAALNQNILAEKLALQRELSTVQVELETERRAVQRTKANTSKQTEADSQNTSRLEELKKELAKDKKEAQRAERESRKKATEWESQKTILESKLDAFRNKLRSTKEQLKQTQKELEDNQASAAVRKVEASAATSTFANPRKRQTAHFDPDASIGTPGNNGVHAAKRTKTSTLPGDKSTFSITPFLNKTMSILPDTPEATESREQAADGQESSPTRAKQPKARKAPAITGRKKESRILQETSSTTNANTSAPKRGSVPTKKPVGLAKVMEEGDDENAEAADTVSELTATVKAPAAIKKKQKILGQRKSLFDEDDDEETKSRARTVGLLGASRGLGGLRGGGRVSSGPISLVGNHTKTIGGFSPLKKDRRPPSVAGSAS